jgi:subtilisin family serine protease
MDSTDSNNPIPIQQLSAQMIGQPKDANGQGCLPTILLIFLVFWIAASTTIEQIARWVIEQGIFDGSFPVTDFRWLISLGYGVGLLVPLIAISFYRKASWLNPIIRTWLFASVLVLIMVPEKLLSVTDQQATNLVQIIGLVIFITLLIVFRFRRLQNGPAGIGITSLQGVPIALLLALILGLPWILWEALGSPMDTLLNGLVGLLFGTAAALLIDQFWQSVQPEAGENYSRKQIGLYGLAAFFILLMMASAVGHNGSQVLLAILMPVLGWGAVSLSLVGRASTRRSSWPAAALFIGVAAAWPLLFVDPDELQFVITSEPGDLATWVVKTGIFCILMILPIVLILFLRSRSLQNQERTPVIYRAAPVGIAIILGLVFALAGRPGFYGERLFVILKDQADLSQALNQKDYPSRRAFVYHALVTQADSTQAPLRQALTRFGIPYTPYYLVNGLEVQGGPIVRAWLMTRPEVDRVLDSPVLRPLPAKIPISTGNAQAPTQPEWNLAMIGAPQVWDMGVTGKGIVIGNSDSGVQGDHPELKDSYRGAGGSNDYNWLDPWFHSTFPTDIGGHGTHTTGTMVGKHTGVAPGAQWIACVNLARNLGNPAEYLNCWQFLLAPFPQSGNPFKDGKPELGANVFNNSWGCPTVEGCDPNTFLPAVRALRAAGVFVVVSTGNSGFSGCGSVKDPPSIYKEVYSVGAVNSAGQLADFSSLGPVTVDGSQRTKPDIAAPGDGVLSSFPGGTYARESGTSMAGPHIVGVVALMWSANPALIGDIDKTTAILDETAIPYQGQANACVNKSTHPNNAAGYGVVNALAAVQKAIGK